MRWKGLPEILLSKRKGHDEMRRNNNLLEANTSMNTEDSTFCSRLFLSAWWVWYIIRSSNSITSVSAFIPSLFKKSMG